MPLQKHVGFNFFYVTRGILEPERIDISTVLEQIRLEYLRQNNDEQIDKYVYEYKGEPAKVASVSVDDNNFYHICFERLFNVQVPIKTTLNGESEFIEIEEGEYVGHEVSALYDPETCVLMLQRNRDSLGPTAIQEFIRSLVFAFNEDNTTGLTLIIDTQAPRRAREMEQYRKISLKVFGESADNLLHGLFNMNRRDSGVDNVEVVITTRNQKDSEIDHELATRILDEYSDNEEVGRLKVSGRPGEGEKVEPVDLVSQKLEAFTTLNYAENRNFNPIAIYERMVAIYSNNGEGYKNRILRM